MDLTDSDFRPPCWPAKTPCPNQCAAQVRDLITRNHVRLHGPWAGWRLVGRELVSPDGVRMSAERARGLAWRVEQEERLARIRARSSARSHRGTVTVVRIPVRDWHAERFGSIAG
jgi:Phage protein.